MKTLFSTWIVGLLMILMSSPAHSEEGTSPKGANELVMLCWTDYMPRPVMDLFEKETGIHITVDYFSTHLEMLQQLLVSKSYYDLIQTTGFMVHELNEGRTDMLSPIDQEKIPNLANIGQEFKNLPFDPGNKYSIPIMISTVGIVVNKTLVGDTKVEHFADAFQERFRDKIVVDDDPVEIMHWTLLSQGTSPEGVSGADLERVRPILQKWLPMVHLFVPYNSHEPMLKGDGALGVIYSGDAAILIDKDPKFQWILPAEQTRMIVDCLAIPKGARHVENAERFMNFLLRPDVSKMFSDFWPGTNPNLKARELMSPKQLANEASYPTAEQMSRLKPIRNVRAEDVETMSNIVRDIRDPFQPTH